LLYERLFLYNAEYDIVKQLGLHNIDNFAPPMIEVPKKSDECINNVTASAW